MYAPSHFHHLGINILGTPNTAALTEATYFLGRIVFLCFCRDTSSKYDKNRPQVLRQREYEFLKALKRGSRNKYKLSYQPTLKLRILRISCLSNLIFLYECFSKIEAVISCVSQWRTILCIKSVLPISVPITISLLFASTSTRMC